MGDGTTKNELDDLRRQAGEWILSITSGDASEEDLEALRCWREQSPRHEDAFNRARRLWASLGPALSELDRRREAAARVHAASRGLQRVSGRRAFLGGALAATAAGTAYAVVRPPLALWPSFRERAADFRTRTGEQRSVTLTHGATVELNTRTSMNVHPPTAGQDALELVSGEALLSTPAGASRRLLVLAAGGRIAATDARFAIRRDGARVRVTCLAGSVEVAHHDRSVALFPRQQVPYGEDGLKEIVAADPALVTAWRTGMLVFRNEPLAHVIDEVNRYRPGRIVLVNGGLGARLVTASFLISRLEDVVMQVREVFGARVTSLPAGLVLLS